MYVTRGARIYASRIVFACACACARACVLTRVCECVARVNVNVRACVRACVFAYVRACVHMRRYSIVMLFKLPLVIARWQHQRFAVVVSFCGFV